MKFISRQNPVVVHIEHLKADWREPREKKTLLTICNTEELFFFFFLNRLWKIQIHFFRATYVKGLWCFQGLHFCLSAMGPLQHAESPHEISLKSMWLSRFSSKAWNKPGRNNLFKKSLLSHTLRSHSHSYLHSVRRGWEERPGGQMFPSQSGRFWTGLSAASIASLNL